MKFKDIKSGLKGFLDAQNLPHKMQERGFKPVFRVITQNSYNDEFLGEKLLIDTLPADVRMRTRGAKVRDDYEDISGTGGAQVIKAIEGVTSTFGGVVGASLGSLKDQILTSLTGSSKGPDDRPFEGCLIDSSHKNEWDFANIIFQNPVATNARGSDMLGTDLIKVGFPIWVYMGYIDNMGNIVSHPFQSESVTHIPLVFAGFAAGLRQEINEAGDRMIIQGAGYRWYIAQFTYNTEDPDYDVSSGKITLDKEATIEAAFNKFFRLFSINGGSGMPKTVANAMRITKVMDSAGGKEIQRCEPTIRYIYGASAKMKPRGRPNIESGMDSFVIGSVRSNFNSILKNIEMAYNVDIEWDVHGYLTVRGFANPFRRVWDVTKSGKAPGTIKPGTFAKGHETRMHDAVLGGNVRNWEYYITADGIASNLTLKIRKPGTGESTETIRFKKKEIDEICEEWEEGDTSSYVYTKEVSTSMGEDDVFNLFGDGKDLTIDVTYYTESAPSKPKTESAMRKVTRGWPEESLSALARRVRHWGLRGTAMLIGDSNIRNGDLIRVTDIRSKEGIMNINLDVAKEVMTSLKDSLIKAKGKDKAASLGMKATDNVYYIWKVRHYIGPAGYWTKIYYARQRDAYSTRSTVMKQMQRQAGEKDGISDG